ncbi:MAG: magnesium chelatase [Planctomycetota bacterium]
MDHPRTLGELKQSGYRPRSVKDELRANLSARLRADEPVFPGVVGYGSTVIPQVVNAILSGHDFILLGLRGQAKTRILRTLSLLLDEAVPMVADSPLREDPLAPLTGTTRARIEAEGDDLPIAWLTREERYHEKLATPDVTIADLIGDVDPIKAASKRLSLDDPEVIHFGLLPRSNRGILAINELPDLQARIQVGLLNILEEGDIQIRGFPLRLPLDLSLTFSANPEDYTNRGNIITPLRDRIASQILTHYPRSVDESMRITDQEAWTERSSIDVTVPDYLRLAVEEVAFRARESELVDQNSGVSARMTISLLENVHSNAERRALVAGADHAVARVSDLAAALPAITGKIELVYEGEREGPRNVALGLVGKAVHSVFEGRLADALRPATEGGEDSEVQPILGWFGGQRTVDLSDDLPDDELYEKLAAIPSLELVAGKYLDPDGEAETSAAMEFVLEGLHQGSLLSKENLVGGRVYRDTFEEMVRSFNS